MNDYHLQDRGLDPNKLSVVKLEAYHAFDKFDCGNEDINDFIKNDALKEQSLWNNNTHIFIYDGEIIGFLTICCSSIKLKIEEKVNHKGLEQTSKIP